MRTCRRCAAFLLSLLLAVPALSAGEKGKSPGPVFEVGAAWSPSLSLFSKFFFASFSPFDFSVRVRLFDFLETSLRAHILCGEDLSGPPLFGVEIAWAPRLDAYMPFIGIGFLFSPVPESNLSGWNITVEQGGLSVIVMCAPLRWGLKDVTPEGTVLFLSFLEIRFGSLIPDDAYPSVKSLGGFYFSVVAASCGIFVTLVREEP
jgi:hypothetical protein